MKLFGKLVSRRSGKQHIVTLIDRVALVHLIADLLPVQSASEVKIQAAVGGLSAMLLPPVTMEPRDEKKKGRHKTKAKEKEKSPGKKSPAKAKGAGKGKGKGKGEAKAKAKDADKKGKKVQVEDEKTPEEISLELDDELVSIALQHGVVVYLIALLTDCPTVRHDAVPELRSKITGEGEGQDFILHQIMWWLP